MADHFRKRKGIQYDTWHFCSNCLLWPTTDYIVSYDKPTTGEFCDQCRSKASSNNCR